MGLFRFTSQRFGGESRKPSEERFGEGFPFYGWKFQVLVDFGFQVLKFFGGCDFGESAEKQLVCPLTFHHFQSIQDLAMRRSLPNGKNHRFPEPAFRAILGQHAQPAVDFHGPLCRIHRKLGGPVFRKMRHQAKQMIAIGVGRPLHPHIVQ